MSEQPRTFRYGNDHLALCVLVVIAVLLLATVAVLSFVQSLPPLAIGAVTAMTLLFGVWAMKFITAHRFTSVRLTDETMIIETRNQRREVRRCNVIRMDYGSRSLAIYFPKVCMDPLIRLYTHEGAIDVPPLLMDKESGDRIGRALIDFFIQDQLSSHIKDNADRVAEGLPLPQRRVLQSNLRNP